jgi:fructosamine-3-kinase
VGARFLQLRTDAWSYGDRVAWEGADPVGEQPTLEQIERLRTVLRTVEATSQVIHGDLGGNVLITDDVPVVIDWPPYYRPVGLSLALAAGDAVRWEDVPVAFLDRWADVPDWYQLLARALVYRLATAGMQQQNGMSVLSAADHAAASEPAVSFVMSRLER